MGVESIEYKETAKGKKKKNNDNKIKGRKLLKLVEQMLLPLLDMALQIERGLNNIPNMRKVKIGD